MEPIHQGQFRCVLTCAIVVSLVIKDHDHLCIAQCLVVVNSGFPQIGGVKDHDPHPPELRDGMQHYMITPVVMIQEMHQTGFVGKWSRISSCASVLAQQIQFVSSQEIGPLLDQIHDYLAPQVSVWEVHKVLVKVSRCLDIEGVSHRCVQTPIITMYLKRQGRSEWHSIDVEKYGINITEQASMHQSCPYQNQPIISVQD